MSMLAEVKLLRKIIFCSTALLIVGVASVFIAIDESYLRDELLPAGGSPSAWRVWTVAGASQGAPAKLIMRDDQLNLNFDFFLSSEAQYPFVNIGFSLDDNTTLGNLVSWQKYTQVNIQIKCNPANLLAFVIYTHEEGVTKESDILTFRPSETYVDCHPGWQDVRLPLDKFASTVWWLEQFNLKLDQQAYQLDKLRGFSIVSTYKSTKDVLASVDINSIRLEGRDFFYVKLAIGINLVLWLGFAYWMARTLLSHKTQHIEYSPVSTEPKHLRDKSGLLQYLATHYPDPNLNLKDVAADIGINRTKINQILKDETGLTFTGYLNKLRLHEAARLISDKNMSVSETAFAVGFGSLSYFNRVFKKEFGCAPSAYRKPDPK